MLKFVIMEILWQYRLRWYGDGKENQHTTTDKPITTLEANI
jgi:hypothetical protein